MRPPAWLPAKNELLYSSGAFGFNVFHQTMTLWLVYFYAPPPDSGRKTIVPLATLGILLGVGRVLDAIDDPLIGYWSDVTRSRWGRRLPFILGAAPLLALTFVLLWTPPAAGLPWTAVYAFFVIQLYFISYCLVHQPYESVLAEIVRNSSGRIRVSSFKVTWGMVGAGVGLVGSGLLLARFGFTAMAAVLAVVALAALFVGALGVRGLPMTAPGTRHIAVWEGLRITATNHQLLVFVGAQVLFYLALNMLTQLVPYFVTVILREPEERVSLFTGLFALVSLASLPVVGWLAGKRGKAFAYRLAMGLLALMLPGLYFIGNLPGTGSTLQGLLYIGLLGAPISALLVLPHPFIADLVDDDETRTGLRREGMYYGVEDTVETLGFALSPAVFSLLLNTFGFSMAQPLGIRLIGPVAGVAVLAGLILFTRGYRLPDHIPAAISMPARTT